MKQQINFAHVYRPGPSQKHFILVIFIVNQLICLLPSPVWVEYNCRIIRIALLCSFFLSFDCNAMVHYFPYLCHHKCLLMHGKYHFIFQLDSLLVTLLTHNLPNLFIIYLTPYHLLFFSNHTTLSFRVLKMTPNLCSQNFTLSNILKCYPAFS